MSKINQTTSRKIGLPRTPFEADPARILTDAEVREAVRRARQMQARAIVGLFSRLGK